MQHKRNHRTLSPLLAALLGGAMVLGICHLGAPAWARPIKVAWEAEKPVKRDDRWMIRPASKNDKKKRLVAGDGYIRHPMLWNPKERPEDGVVPPVRLVYEFTVSTTGVYYFWAKVYWFDECHNSFWVGFDKDVPVGDWASLSYDARTPKEKTYVFGEDAVYLRWHWVPYNSGDLATGGGVRLTKGKHRVYIRAREDGLSIDRFLLINDRDYVATGQNG